MARERLFFGMVFSALVMTWLVAGSDRTSATFTATSVSPDNVFETATLAMSNDKPNAGQLASVVGMVPGDTATRSVTITNSGGAGFTYTATAVSGATQTLLWTDTVNGLQVTAKRGITVLYTGALKNLAIQASSTIAPLGTDTLTFDFSLPSTAPNTHMGLRQFFSVNYTATQLAGTSR